MAKIIAVLIARILLVLLCVLMATILVWAIMQMVHGIIQLARSIKEELKNGNV